MFDYKFDHLARMTDEHGMLEHSSGSNPRLDCGYCTDDNARLLMVAARHADAEPMALLGRRALHFVLSAATADGRMFNRYGATDTGLGWQDRPATGDWWGRAVGALGSAAAEHPDPQVRASARRGFERSAHLRSAWPHAMAYAIVGAADLLEADSTCNTARDLVQDGLDQLSGTFRPWPEPRLTYANATLAEALIAGGHALGDDDALAIGLDRLHWLRTLQTRDGHLSLVGTGGRDLHDREVQFDQQPIEAATLADAAFRAWTITGDRYWADTVIQCAAWFEGDNDVGCTMYDPYSGGSFDGLKPNGPNTNQGAESTLALIATFQRAREVRSSVLAAGVQPAEALVAR